MQEPYPTWEVAAYILSSNVASSSTKCASRIASRYSRFSAAWAPDISIEGYLDRIHQYSGCSDECFVVALIYLDRVLKAERGLLLSQINVHRLTLVSMILAIKYLDDIYADNKSYAVIGGIPLKEVNSLERNMLQMLDYKLYVTQKEFLAYNREMKARFRTLEAAKQQPMIVEDLGCCEARLERKMDGPIEYQRRM